MRAYLTAFASAAAVGSVLLLSTGAAAQPGITNQRRFVAIGCVTREGPASTPRFILTDSRGDRPTTFRLRGNAEELARHVGHRIEAAGTLGPAAGAQPTLTVTSVVWLASTCRT